MAKTYHLGAARRLVNLVVKRMVRLGIGGKSTYELTTTGRTTGQQRTTPVTLVESDGDAGLCRRTESWAGFTTSEPTQR